MLVNQKFTLLPFASETREAIMRLLAAGPILGTDLLERLQAISPITKQGLYKALRELLRDEIALKEGRYYSLNKTWLTRLNDYRETSERNLGLRLPFPETTTRGRKVINFANAAALDIYWSHMFLTLSEQYPNKALFFYNHHSFFSLERPDAEAYLIRTISKLRYRLMVTFGQRTALNQHFKQQVQSDTIQIAIDEGIKVPATDHLSIIGDYFITTRYNAGMMKRIHQLFKAALSPESVNKKQLHEILYAGKGLKMIIMKDAAKAMLWKKRLAKNFIVKKSDL